MLKKLTISILFALSLASPVLAGEIALGQSCNPGDSENKCAEGSCLQNDGKNICANYAPLVGIPGTAFAKGKAIILGNDTKQIALFIQAIYNYVISIAGILAALVMMAAGFLWITAGGNQNTISKAKQMISGATIGLVLALCSFIILKTVNPDLVNLKTIEVAKIESITTGCCEKDKKNIGNKTQSDCKREGGKWGGENSIWNINSEKCEIDSGGCCVNSNNGLGDQFTNNNPICSNVTNGNYCSGGFFNYNRNQACENIAACKGCYIGGPNNLKSCEEGKICFDGICRNCESGSGSCSLEPCCEGSCCNGLIFKTCIAGTPKNGKYCE